MRALAHTAIVGLAVAGCALDPVDVDGKGCPCLAGRTCKIESKQCIVYPNTPVSTLGCAIYTDGKLYCQNAAPAALHASPNATSAVVNHLTTTYSWFDCWATGELQADGNTTWFYTLGDENGVRGWIPGAAVKTPAGFAALTQGVRNP